MKQICLLLLLFLIPAILLSEQFVELNYPEYIARSYAGSNKNLINFINRYNECCSSGKIDCVRCGDYAASGYKLDRFLSRWNTLNNDYRGSAGEFASLVAGSNIKIDDFLAKVQNAERESLFEAGIFYAAYAASNQDPEIFKLRYDEICKAYPDLYIAHIYYAISKHTLDVFIKRYYEVIDLK
ncbi:MAG: hypothetical protein JW982_16605 [Spirochaetes bacterium]|nr:hypothetical protein [Spirochaetota bacterium]